MKFCTSLLCLIHQECGYCFQDDSVFTRHAYVWILIEKPSSNIQIFCKCTIYKVLFHPIAKQVMGLIKDLFAMKQRKLHVINYK